MTGNICFCLQTFGHVSLGVTDRFMMTKKCSDFKSAKDILHFTITIILKTIFPATLFNMGKQLGITK